MSQPEGKLSKNIIKALNARDRCFAWKATGDPRIRRGISDIQCVYRGRFVPMEVKMPGKEDNVTEMQQDFMDRVLAAGGRPAVVTSVRQALLVLDGIDEQLRRRALRVVARAARSPAFRREFIRKLRR
jgi:hypothetical protein